MSRVEESTDDRQFAMGRGSEPATVWALEDFTDLMVFPVLPPWTKVPHPASAGKDLQAQEASVEPALALTLPLTASSCFCIA